MGHTDKSTLSRRTEILEMVENAGQVSVLELSKKYSISEVSIRNDLSHLEQKGLLIRTRGGAIKRQPVNFDLNLNSKLKKHYKEKKRIGKKAAEMVNEGDTIVIDSGSTTLEIANNLLEFNSLTVITNSLPIAEKLSENENINVIVPGGILRQEMRSLVGSMTEKNLKELYADIAFLAVDGIDSEHGISTPNIEEASIGKTLTEIAKKVVVVTDSSKFLSRSMAKITDIQFISTIITDIKIPKEEHRKLIDKKIEVITV